MRKAEGERRVSPRSIPLRPVPPSQLLFPKNENFSKIGNRTCDFGINMLFYSRKMKIFQKVGINHVVDHSQTIFG